MLRMMLALVAVCCGSGPAQTQDPSALQLAKALDQESRSLKDKPDSARTRGIRKLATRIRQLPAQYAVPLAQNLAIDHTDLDDRGSLQKIADTLAYVLRNAPEPRKEESRYMYRALAELTFFDHARVSLDDPLYSAALRELDREDQQRHDADFTLGDLDGKEWSFRGLRGNVVLINFWADWCPPCRKELAWLKSISARFSSQGLVVLTIPVMYEELDRLRHFVTEQNLGLPILIDREHKVQDLFHVKDVPASFIYDRSGQLVRKRFRRMQDFTNGLSQAGLR